MDQIYTILKQAKLRLLKMHFESQAGHIGGNLSCLDVMILLHHLYLNKDNNQFVLSKGHAAGALYIALWSRGVLTDEELRTFHGLSTKLAGHPPPNWLDEVAFATGSLGHGLSLAAGLAMGKKLQKLPGEVFCLTSDGEWQEGSTWEALIFLSHHKLNNITIIIDKNDLQGFGSTDEVASLADLSRKLKPFSIDLYEVDGHDLESIHAAIEKPQVRPKIIVLATTKGRGVSFMEHKMEWHYLPMKEHEYRLACEEVSKS